MCSHAGVVTYFTDRSDSDVSIGAEVTLFYPENVSEEDRTSEAESANERIRSAATDQDSADAVVEAIQITARTSEDQDFKERAELTEEQVRTKGITITSGSIETIGGFYLHA